MPASLSYLWYSVHLLTFSPVPLRSCVIGLVYLAVQQWSQQHDGYSNRHDGTRVGGGGEPRVPRDNRSGRELDVWVDVLAGVWVDVLAGVLADVWVERGGWGGSLREGARRAGEGLEEGAGMGSGAYWDMTGLVSHLQSV